MENTENLDNVLVGLFENARTEFDKIDNNSKQQKNQVIKDLAKSLEGKIPIDSICIEITNQLRSRVSESFVRQCLDDKYKQSHRADNAKKQNRKQTSDKLKEKVEKLASVTTLNQEDQNDKIIIVEATGQALVQTDPDYSDNDNSLLNNEDPFDKNIATGKDSSNIHHQKEKQKGILKLRECPSCIEVNSENVQLKEIIKKQNQFTTADNI